LAEPAVFILSFSSMSSLSILALSWKSIIRTLHVGFILTCDVEWFDGRWSGKCEVKYGSWNVMWTRFKRRFPWNEIYSLFVNEIFLQNS
jgi:hypothetical protein